MIEDSKKYIEKIVSVDIDRPLGSAHPKFGWQYPVNYGYVPNTKAADGEELDVYILLLDEPVKTFAGRCIAVIHRVNDDDDKLVVIPADKENLTNEDIRKMTDFQEKFFKSEIVRD